MLTIFVVRILTLYFYVFIFFTLFLYNFLLFYFFIYCINSYMAQKKTFSTRVDEGRIKALKHLAVDTDKSLGVLLEEAIADLVRKYEKKGIRS